MVPSPLPDLPDDLSSDRFSLLARPDGRQLSYCTFGDPTGFPTFYFHGTPSSRLEGAFADAAAKRHGYQLIAIDRPGFGRSTFQPGRRFIDWPDEVTALADHLCLSRFGVVGHSGAGPHLFACGALIPAERLVFIGALAPWGALTSPTARARINRLDRAFSKLAQRLPWLMHAGFAPMGWTVKHWPWLFFRLMRGAVSEADKQALRHPSMVSAFTLIEQEAFRQGAQGPAHEAMIAYRDWGFSLSGAKVPALIWLGTDDIFVPQIMGKELAKNLPNAQLHWMPGQGHFAIEAWDDIMAACTEHKG